MTIQDHKTGEAESFLGSQNSNGNNGGHEVESITKDPQESPKQEPKFVIDDDNVQTSRTVDLEHDVYGIMFVSGLQSFGCVYAVVVWVMQITILCMIIVDLTTPSDARPGTLNMNPLSIPEDVSGTVAAAQFLALFVSVTSCGDFMSSMNMLRVGYPKGVRQEYKGATRTAFYVSNFLRLLEGLMLLVCAFLIVVQSESVIKIFFDFSAIEFVSYMDNAAFQLAMDGFLNHRLERAAKKVARIKLRDVRPHLKWVSGTIFAMVFLGVTAAWAVVRLEQFSGHIFTRTACLNLDVRFGDDVYTFPDGIKFNITVDDRGLQTLPGSTRPLPFLDIGQVAPPLFFGYFSNDFRMEMTTDFLGRETVLQLNERPIYWENGFKDPTSGKFYYCQNVRAWVFTIDALFNTPGLMPDEAKEECPESGWLMQSPVTNALVLEEAPLSDWNVWTGKVETASDLSVSCLQCSRDAECGLIRGYCDAQKRSCVCDEGWEGHFCQTEQPLCNSLVWLDYGNSSKQLNLYGPYWKVDGVVNYDRPIYSSENHGVGNNSFAELYLYTGRRWYDIFMLDTDIVIVSSQLNSTFHAYWDDVFERNTAYFSDPTNEILPIGLQWYQVRFSKSKGSYGPFGAHFEIEAALECLDTRCTEDKRICGRSGTCVTVSENDRNYSMTHIYQEYLHYYDNNSLPLPEFSMCLCTENYGGHFCEFDPFDPYAIEQYYEFVVNNVSLDDWRERGENIYPQSFGWNKPFEALDSQNATAMNSSMAALIDAFATAVPAGEAMFNNSSAAVQNVTSVNSVAAQNQSSVNSVFSQSFLNNSMAALTNNGTGLLNSTFLPFGMLT